MDEGLRFAIDQKIRIRLKARHRLIDRSAE